VLQLPDTGCAPQLALLQVFQQLVELRESGRVLADVLPQQQRPDQQYGDTKDILETWRCAAQLQVYIYVDCNVVHCSQVVI
jgi:hypothetical protein